MGRPTRSVKKDASEKVKSDTKKKDDKGKSETKEKDVKKPESEVKKSSERKSRSKKVEEKNSKPRTTNGAVKKDSTNEQSESKGRKRKVVDLTPTASPSGGRYEKAAKRTETKPKSQKREAPTSPYFKDEKPKTNVSQGSPLKKSSQSSLSPSSSKTATPKKEGISISFDANISQFSPMKENATNAEKLEMMRNYMGDKVDEMSDDSSSDDGGDWEEVADMPHFSEPLPEKKEEMPAVQVVVEAPELFPKKKKKNREEEEFARKWNKFMRELRLDMHKTHLLCLISHGLQRNALCWSPVLKALALSMIPSEYLELRDNLKQHKGFGRVFVNKVLRWFVTEFSVESNVKEEVVTSELLQKRFATKKVASDRELLYIILVILRVLMVRCRLCINLRPITKKVPGKPTTTKALRQSKKAEESKKKKKVGKSAKPKNSIKRKKDSKVVDLTDSDDGTGDHTVELSSDDSDFEVSPPKSAKKPKSTKKSKKIKSSDSEDSVIITKAKVKNHGVDEWLEVFIEQENQWFTVDVCEPKFDCTLRMEKNATKPIIYVLGFDNQNRIKDLTMRYNSQFSTEAKLRVDEAWWNDTLLYYKEPVTDRTERENAQLHAQVLKRPFPNKLEEFKNHPLYALERHLKKFEAIYPRTAVPLGYAKNKEPIYARECIKELHARNSWLKEARLVRVDEKPYKIVKARKNFRKPALPGSEEEKLELFGLWQTEEYMPPIAFDGKVPKNEYGNVEMYKPSMLPTGCKHLRLPGLNKVAKKLGLDVAPAMTGWDVHGGWSHPILDGFIVIEEDVDVLIAAWDEDQEIQKAKQREKREQAIYDNWKLLIKGVLIRERLKNRYDLCEKADGASTMGKKVDSNSHLSFASKLSKLASTSQDETNLFPFEKE